MPDIGGKIKRLRTKLSLTQEELAARCELSKGFISQVERNLTSPSIATLMDILEALGTDLSGFFAESGEERVVFLPDEVFTKEDTDTGYAIDWLIPNAQKNLLEPILVTLSPGGRTDADGPHEGEEFGYVLSGGITLILGEQKYRVRRGASFCFKPNTTHSIVNTGRSEARFIWIATPPSF